MLKLTRRVGEKIIIETDNHRIEVSLEGTNGNQAKLGFKCKREVIVHREEIWHKINDEKRNMECNA